MISDATLISTSNKKRVANPSAEKQTYSGKRRSNQFGLTYMVIDTAPSDDNAAAMKKGRSLSELNSSPSGMSTTRIES
jgi:hypothetical protein